MQIILSLLYFLYRVVQVVSSPQPYERWKGHFTTMKNSNLIWGEITQLRPKAITVRAANQEPYFRL